MLGTCGDRLGMVQRGSQKIHDELPNAEIPK
jgi:hypothetical protein